jgi:hypothetical protein
MTPSTATATTTTNNKKKRITRIPIVLFLFLFLFSLTIVYASSSSTGTLSSSSFPTNSSSSTTTTTITTTKPTTTSTTTSKKDEKVAFVTGHTGSTPWEVLLVCMSVVTGCAVYGQLRITFVVVGMTTNNHNNNKNNNNNMILWFIIEAIVLWLPIVLCQTIYLYPWGVLILLIQIGITVLLKFLWWRRRMVFQHQPPSTTLSSTSTTTSGETGSHNDDPFPSQQSHHPHPHPSPHLSYMTIYRSALYYLTFVAILAVDFHVFPRRFCKTELYGYGLMDVGAASFCISSGLIGGIKRMNRHRHQHHHHHTNQHYNTTIINEDRVTNPTTTTKSTSPSTIITMIRPFMGTTILVMIGIIRIVTNRELDYPEHVTEYGVHWNFFFTLGILALVPSIITYMNKLSIVVAVGGGGWFQRRQRRIPQRNDDHHRCNKDDDDDDDDTPSFFGPIIGIVLYQIVLSYGGWQHFIETAPRTIHEVLTVSSTSSSVDNNADPLTRFIAVLFDSTTTKSTSKGIGLLLWRVTNFFLANREGILGCIGYLTLYYWGKWIGYHYVSMDSDDTSIPTTTTTATESTADKDGAAACTAETNTTTATATTPTTTTIDRMKNNNHHHSLGICAAALWTVHGILSSVLQLPVSRRSTNLNFCVWVLAHNILLLYGLKLVTTTVSTTTATTAATTTTAAAGSIASIVPTIERRGSQSPTSVSSSASSYPIPLVWKAVNRHGLIMFLIANLLTGLVNITIPTLRVGDIPAVGIVYGYIVTIGIIAMILDNVLLVRNNNIIIQAMNSIKNSSSGTGAGTSRKGTMLQEHGHGFSRIGGTNKED